MININRKKNREKYGMTPGKSFFGHKTKKDAEDFPVGGWSSTFQEKDGTWSQLYCEASIEYLMELEAKNPHLTLVLT